MTDTLPVLRPGADADLDRVSAELSSRRTGMSFQRTRLSADRTLMSVIRTSLSLISFGFTIFQFLGKLRETSLTERIGDGAAQHFGITLVALGIGMLVLGIVYHLLFMVGLRHERAALRSAGIIHGTSGFPTSLTLITALILLAIGVGAILSMVFGIGPFH